MTDQRPVHVVLAGTDVTTRAIGNDEWTQMQAAAAAAAEAVQAAEKARQADLAAVAERAAQDPAIAALARLLGLSLPAPAAEPTTPTAKADGD